MPFKKGESGNPGGRAIGSKNKLAAEWEALAEDIIGMHSERFNSVLGGMNDEEFARNYTNILNYFKPRLASTQVKQETELKHSISDDELNDRLNKILTAFSKGVTD